MMEVSWSSGIIPLTEKEYKELKEKAEKLGDISSYPKIKFGPLTALEYLDLVELQAEHYTRRAILAEEKLRAVREFVLSRRDDIEKDIENFGMLKPVLDYFLEEAEGDG